MDEKTKRTTKNSLWYTDHWKKVTEVGELVHAVERPSVSRDMSKMNPKDDVLALLMHLRNAIRIPFQRCNGESVRNSSFVLSVIRPFHS